MYIYTYKSITTKWWDNPRLAKQAVAKKIPFTSLNLIYNVEICFKILLYIHRQELSEMLMWSTCLRM